MPVSLTVLILYSSSRFSSANVYFALFQVVFQVDQRPAEHAFLLAQRFEDVTIMRFELIAV